MNWNLVPDRDEQDVDKCIQSARLNSQDPQKKYTEMRDGQRGYLHGRVVLEVTPREACKWPRLPPLRFRGRVPLDMPLRRAAKNGRTRMKLTPSLVIGVPGGVDLSLTYGIFCDATLGINQFRLFYPHLDFVYEIYVRHNEESESEYRVGTGELRTFC